MKNCHPGVAPRQRGSKSVKKVVSGVATHVLTSRADFRAPERGLLRNFGPFFEGKLVIFWSFLSDRVISGSAGGFGVTFSVWDNFSGSDPTFSSFWHFLEGQMGHFWVFVDICRLSVTLGAQNSHFWVFVDFCRSSGVLEVQTAYFEPSRPGRPSLCSN